MKLYKETPTFELTRQGEVEIHIRFRPAKLVGILTALLLHALLFYFLMSLHQEIKTGKTANNPIVLFFDKVAALKQSKPEQKKATATANKKAISKSAQPVIVTDQTRDLPPPPEIKEAPVVDMMTMLNAQREQRRIAEEAAATENQAAQQGSRGLSPQEIAEANVKRSMQQANGQQGTNGVFQILTKSTRMGTFSFRGWKKNSNSWRQVIEVDAGLGGNIDLAMVRRMIELIRTHYKGDFRWESQRLGRVVNLSARIEDSAELEAFMLQEFPDFNGAK